MPGPAVEPHPRHPRHDHGDGVQRPLDFLRRLGALPAAGRLVAATRFARLPDAETLSEVAYWSVLVGFPLLTLGHRPRRLLGQLSLGPLLGLGPQGDLRAADLVRLRRLPARPRPARLGRQTSRLPAARWATLPCCSPTSPSTSSSRVCTATRAFKLPRTAKYALAAGVAVRLSSTSPLTVAPARHLDACPMPAPAPTAPPSSRRSATRPCSQVVYPCFLPGSQKLDRRLRHGRRRAPAGRARLDGPSTSRSQSQYPPAVAPDPAGASRRTDRPVPQRPGDAARGQRRQRQTPVPPASGNKTASTTRCRPSARRCRGAPSSQIARSLQ